MQFDLEKREEAALCQAGTCPPCGQGVPTALTPTGPPAPQPRVPVMILSGSPLKVNLASHMNPPSLWHVGDTGTRWLPKAPPHAPAPLQAEAEVQGAAGCLPVVSSIAHRHLGNGTGEEMFLAHHSAPPSEIPSTPSARLPSLPRPRSWCPSC